MGRQGSRQALRDSCSAKKGLKGDDGIQAPVSYSKYVPKSLFRVVIPRAR